MFIPSDVKKILDRLMDVGCDAYVVGGSLRDALLGREASDWDVTSAARPERVMELFSHLRVIPTGLKHGTVTVITEEGHPVEITTFRTDGSYSDSRHPESVSFASSVEDDLSRRDFTINAMAYNESRGLVDLFGGKEDLNERRIRCVGDPETRFREDALRILRAFRFASQLDFEIDPETLAGAYAARDGLDNIARERIGVETLKLLDGASPSRPLSLMGDILGNVLPTPIDQRRIESVSELECDAVGRLSYLLCGASEEMVRVASHWLRLSSKQASRLQKLVRPIAPHRLQKCPSDAEMRRIIREYRDDAATAVKIASHLYEIHPKTEEVLRRIEAEDPIVDLSRLAVKGSDLIKCGVASGTLVGETLSMLLEAVIDDPSLNKPDILLDLAQKWQKTDKNCE